MALPPKRPIPPPFKKGAFQAKREDSFWPIVIILAIICFTASFWVFYMLTNKINTRTFNTSEVPTLMLTPTPSTFPSTIVIGEGQGGSPSPSVSPSKSPEQTPSKSSRPSPTPTPTPSPSVSVSPTPTPKPTPTPSLEPTVSPSASKEQETIYRVQVGTFTGKDEAQKVSNELTDLGYSVVVIEDGGTYHVQLGSYQSQERAVALAEEVTQKGYSVVVRQIKH